MEHRADHIPRGSAAILRPDSGHFLAEMQLGLGMCSCNCPDYRLMIQTVSGPQRELEVDRERKIDAGTQRWAY